ncbi:helix-turn-helix domain-containing protein [Enterococcus faecium]|uniref:helix-turn-helix domain-containing protein n=1 Tax=Enterococcus faecium TaxID=1352 RepID=UPI001F33A3EE|nr:helix-turn-helix domain-containing protein [Enterococcus faecium]MBX9060441.1 hypothetical protein [Enterococcus faecium]
MFFNIVFTQKERRKLAIFHLLEEQHELTIKEISKKLDLSSSVVKNILNEMENEFDDFCFSGFKLLSKNKINQNLPIDLNYDYYYSYLIQQSLPYRAMKSSLFYPEKNLMEFCQENFISRASAMRHLQSLADYVQEFDVIFNRSQLSFKGDERLIRLILFNILWAASRGNEDYAFYVSKSELLKKLAELTKHTSLNWSFVGKKEVCLFAGITTQRIAQGHYVEDDPRYSEAVFSNDHRIKCLFGEHFSIPASHQDSEFRFAQFMVFYAPTFQYENPTLNEALDIFDKKGQLLSSLLKELDNYWQTEIFPDDRVFQHNQIVHLHLFNILFCYYLFPKRVPTLFFLMNYFHKKKSSSYYYLKEHFTFFLNKLGRRHNYQWLSICCNDLAEIFAWLTLQCCEDNENSTKLQVSLVMETNYFFTQDIKNFLKDLSFIELKELSYEEIQPIDFLIVSSVHLMPKETDTSYYVVNFLEGKTDYVKLYLELKKAHENKKFHLLLKRPERKNLPSIKPQLFV